MEPNDSDFEPNPRSTVVLPVTLELVDRMPFLSAVREMGGKELDDAREALKPLAPGTAKSTG